jgi:hypothetical protein
MAVSPITFAKIMVLSSAVALASYKVVDMMDNFKNSTSGLTNLEDMQS